MLFLSQSHARVVDEVVDSERFVALELGDDVFGRTEHQVFFQHVGVVLLAIGQFFQRNLPGKAVVDITQVAKQVFELSQHGLNRLDRAVTPRSIFVQRSMAHHRKARPRSAGMRGKRLIELALVQFSLGKRARQRPGHDVAVVLDSVIESDR